MQELDLPGLSEGSLGLIGRIGQRPPWQCFGEARTTFLYASKEGQQLVIERLFKMESYEQCLQTSKLRSQVVGV